MESTWNNRSAVLPARSDLHLARKIWHLTAGVVLVLIYRYSGISQAFAVLLLGAAFVFLMTLETMRLHNPNINRIALRLWRPFIRSGELDRISGLPYYVCAAMLAIGIFPEKIAVLSLLYLAVGDPTASFFGILYGHRSVKFASGKSLIGTAAGVIVCTMLSLFILSDLPLQANEWWALSLIGGLAGGISELIPLEVDDNFTVPLISGFVLWIAFIFFGV